MAASLAAAIGNSGQVAVTVSVDPERGVAGQIAPGDRVDILVVNEGAANYILNDVKVLAVGANHGGRRDQRRHRERRRPQPRPG